MGMMVRYLAPADRVQPGDRVLLSVRVERVEDGRIYVACPLAKRLGDENSASWGFTAPVWPHHLMMKAG